MASQFRNTNRSFGWFLSSAALSMAVAAAGLMVSVAASAAATPQDIASALVQAKDDWVARDAALANGYSIYMDMACTAGSGTDDYAEHCMVFLSNTKQSSVPASIQFVVYDRDVNFNTIVSDLQSGMKAAPGQTEMQEDTTISKTFKDTASGKSTVTTAPGLCAQSLGRPNTPAICGYKAGARILMIVAVAPMKANLEQGDNPGQDVDQARKLGLVGIMYLHAAQDLLDAEAGVVDIVKRKLDQSR